MRGDVGFPVRVRFAKHGKVRFIGHRDVARAFERAFRIEQLPLAFTLGFSPRPKVSFGLALSVGHESDAEYLDVEMADPIDLDGLSVALSQALPEGIDVTGVAPLVERAPALQESVTTVSYRMTVDGDRAVASAVNALLQRSTLEVVRRRKGRETVEDIRPALRHLSIVDIDDDAVTLEVEVTTQPTGVRPAEIVAALHLCGAGRATEGRVLRTHQWIERGGARQEPLEADRRSRVPEACAS